MEVIAKLKLGYRFFWTTRYMLWYGKPPEITKALAS